MTTYDWVIVGAGFTGATFARAMADKGKSVLVVDRRLEIGGNAAEGFTSQGLRHHKYGAHIFHTNDRRIMTFLEQYSEWIPYVHHVGVYLGPSAKLITLPFNFAAIDTLYPVDSANEIKNALSLMGKDGDKLPVLKLMESPDAVVAELAKDVYRWIFLEYTQKQWGMLPEQLDPSVTARVPIRIGYDDRWFADEFQVMPKHGYNRLFENLLHGIPILLGIDGREAYDLISADHYFYTGPIDEFYDHRLGHLPYRSLHFKHSVYEWTDRIYPHAVINYTTRMEQYTRVIEQKQLTFQEHPHALLTYEYPQAHVYGQNEPYYPIPRADNRALYERYRQLAEESHPNIVWAGRLGRYTYINMDQAVGMALSLADRLG